ADRRRSGHRDHIPVAVPHAESSRAVRPRAGRGILADLFPHHPSCMLRAVQLHERSGSGRREMKGPTLFRGFPGRTLLLALYFLFTLAPIYWMVHMSLRTNEAILGAFAWVPESVSFANYVRILTDPSWYDGYINSIIYVAINTVLSVCVALPAAYAFSRYSFLGDKHLFFWLLTNRMTPPAVFLLPFFQLYTAIGLMDTHLAVAL